MSEREPKRHGVDERRDAERDLRQDETDEEESEAPGGASHGSKVSIAKIVGILVAGTIAIPM
jgi:hypothetical protein